MMRTATITVLVIATVVVFAPTADADDRWEALSSEAEARLDATPERGEPDAERIDAMLADGLTRDDAVQIALMTNWKLQAAFDELGIARADLRQAGLYSNPEIETVILWPDEGDADIDVEAKWNIADLWRVPVRKRVAAARADRVTMTVLTEVLNTAADARMAWDGAIAAAEMVAETREVLDAAEDLLAQMQERFDFGFGEELGIARMRAAVAEVELELAMAEATREIALSRLQRVLGLRDTAPVQPVGSLPEAPADLSTGEELVAVGLSERPEVRAADLGVRAAGQQLRLERRSTWKRVQLGPAWARKPDGDELWGVVLDVDLPIADSNRAARLRADAELSRAEDLAVATRTMVRAEVEIALENLALAQRKERLIRETIIPAHEDAHGFAQRHFMQMELSMLPVIETRRELAAAQRLHVEARRQVAEALVELEFAVGGRLP